MRTTTHTPPARAPGRHAVHQRKIIQLTSSECNACCILSKEPRNANSLVRAGLPHASLAARAALSPRAPRSAMTLEMCRKLEEAPNCPPCRAAPCHQAICPAGGSVSRREAGGCVCDQQRSRRRGLGGGRRRGGAAGRAGAHRGPTATCAAAAASAGCPPSPRAPAGHPSADCSVRSRDVCQ